MLSSPPADSSGERSVSEEKMVTIELDIEDALLFDLMKKAHEADVTFNRYIQSLLEDYLEELDRGEGPPSAS